jgi:hypothetical protein
LLHNAIAISKKYDPQSYPDDEMQIVIVALYAFDDAWLLIVTIKINCQQNPRICLSLVNTSYCLAGQLSNHIVLNKIIQTMNFTGVLKRVQFQPNTTASIDRTGAHYMIRNVQPSRANVNKLQIVAVSKLNGTIMNNRRKSTPQWVESAHKIQWPSKLLEPSSEGERGWVSKVRLVLFNISPSPIHFTTLPTLGHPTSIVFLTASTRV